MNVFSSRPLLVGRWSVRRAFARQPVPGSVASTVPELGQACSHCLMFPPPGAGSCTDGTLHIKVSQVTWPSPLSPRE